MLALHEDDLVTSAGTVQHIQVVLSRKRRHGYLTKVGRATWEVPSNEYIEIEDTSMSVNRFLVAYQKHARFIVENVKSLALQCREHNRSYNPAMFTVSHAGLSSRWTMDEFDDIVGISDETVSRISGGLFFKKQQSYSGRIYWQFASVVPKDSSLVSEAYVEARMRLLTGSMHSFSYDKREENQTFWVQSSNITYRDELGVEQRAYMTNLSGWSQFESAYAGLVGPVSGKLVFSARNDLLANLRVEAANRERVARQVSRENFTKYWSSLKGTIKSVVDSDEVVVAWQTIPIQPKGTLASRTWGIEIETVRADLVSRPLGWDERSDGSLESMNDDCGCGCDDCDNGNCCGYDDCGTDDSDCAEFVSPILRHFNSDGLRKLCKPLDGVRSNTSPGIHVHVGADDLSVSDVARLIRAYSAVSPFLEPISYRAVRNYCQDVSTNNLAHWLAASREHMKRTTNDRAVDVSAYQPDNRYHDLNLIALQAHGTVEFRVMGPRYNYDHLVRWAWFCREMVNLSKLDIPQTTWTAVRSMADVLAIIKQYGSESTPDSWLSESDDLVVESDAEAAHD